jgi:hypothetical protein
LAGIRLVFDPAKDMVDRAKHAVSLAFSEALAVTDWSKVDAMTDTDQDIARQIASNPDAAPDMAPEVDVRAIRRAAGMAKAIYFSRFLRTRTSCQAARRPSQGCSSTCERAARPCLSV